MMRTTFQESFWALFGYAAIGAITVPIAIASFLWIGYLLTPGGK
jgi:hypothetical protein